MTDHLTKLPYNDAKISNDAKVKSAKWYPTSPAMSDADRKVAVRDQVRFEDGYMVGYKAALASETHIEIDDCSMLGKPSSKLGFYTVTMFPDDGKPVNLRLSKDVAEALASVLTIGGEIDDSTELPPLQAQPQDDTRELVKQARAHIRAFNQAMDGPHPEAAYISKLCDALETGATIQANDEDDHRCADCGDLFLYGLQAVSIATGFVCRKCWSERNA